jgi:uncharacterized membrane protein YgaE (UPF0421/DUF939 family)
MKEWLLERFTSQNVEHIVHTSVTATLSLIIAITLGLPEPIWAVIGAMIITQSSRKEALALSVKQISATVVGAVTGALISTYIGANFLSFAFGLFLLGILCLLMHLEKASYRFSGISLSLVMFLNTQQHNTVWEVAFYRSVEITIGILTGLTMSILWPERPTTE